MLLASAARRFWFGVEAGAGENSQQQTSKVRTRNLTGRLLTSLHDPDAGVILNGNQASSSITLLEGVWPRTGRIADFERHGRTGEDRRADAHGCRPVSTGRLPYGDPRRGDTRTSGSQDGVRDEERIERVVLLRINQWLVPQHLTFDDSDSRGMLLLVLTISGCREAGPDLNCR